MYIYFSSVGHDDRVVVQEVIKSIAQTQQLDSNQQKDFKGNIVFINVSLSWTDVCIALVVLDYDVEVDAHFIDSILSSGMCFEIVLQG